MAQDTESFNSELYDLLKVRGYKPVPLNSQNQRVRASQEADVIEFTFTKDGEEYGKAWLSIDDSSNIKVYFDDEQQESPNTTTPGVDYDDTWTGFLKHLKKWAQRRQLSFELSNKDRLGDDMRQRDYYKMKEKLGESYHPMGKKASYNDAIPNIKIILQHNRALEEGEQRYRNVAKIFLENQDGERFLAPTTRPGIARVYARHIAEGGLPNDDRWNHIKSICEEYNKMAGFVRATRNKEFNESAQVLVNEGANHYANLRETLHKLTGHRGYHAYFESWTPNLMEDEFSEDISEMFMSSSLDPRIESVMPILSRLKKTVNEMEEVDTLAEWADDIINEKLELESAGNVQTRVVGNGDKTFDAVHPQTKEKLIVRAFGPQQAKDIAGKEWNMDNSAGVLITTSDTPAASAPGKNSAIDHAQSKLSPKKPSEKEPGKKLAVSDPNYQLPGGQDALSNLGRLGAALAGVTEGNGSDEEDNVVKLKPKKRIGHSVLAKDFDNEFGHYDELGRIGKLASINDRAEDDMDWDDDSWIPDLEDFEDEEIAKELSRHRGRFAANDLKEMDKEHGSKRDFDGPKGPDKTAKAIPAKKAAKDARKALDKAFKGDVEENFIGMAPQAVAEEEVEEGLDANQKRAGQLGPTEKVKNNNIGKLVGASESTEIDPELARIIEMARFKR